MHWPTATSRVYSQPRPQSLFPSPASAAGQEDESSAGEEEQEHICNVSTARNARIYATLTRSSLTLWQNSPRTILASIVRSESSVLEYGANKEVHLKPDASTVIVVTLKGHCLFYGIFPTRKPTYAIVASTDSRQRHSRRVSNVQRANSDNYSASGHSGSSGVLGWSSGQQQDFLFESTNGVVGVELVQQIALHLGSEDGLIEVKASAATDRDVLISVVVQGSEELAKIPWSFSGNMDEAQRWKWRDWKWFTAPSDDQISNMNFDRAMGVMVASTSTGSVFFFTPSSDNSYEGSLVSSEDSDLGTEVISAINGSFSLIAIGNSVTGIIKIYQIRSLTGNLLKINSISLPSSISATGKLTFLAYSPDGLSLLAGYEYGWTTFSVYGQLISNCFPDSFSAKNGSDKSQNGVSMAFWAAYGSELVIFTPLTRDARVIDFMRAAASTNHVASNVTNGLIIKPRETGLMWFKGRNMSDLTAIAPDAPVWEHVVLPLKYVLEQGPIRTAVISPGGNYICVAGQRGLAHYSSTSRRWKCFDDDDAVSEFCVRGGMVWVHHFLIAAIESYKGSELRVYSRESSLNFDTQLDTVELESAVVYMTVSGEDSLLVFTADNTLLHFVIQIDFSGNPKEHAIQLIKVGEIHLHGIIGSPYRVRALSWLLPDSTHDEFQTAENRSVDVSIATILFLVDGRLTLLQPSLNEDGMRKYEIKTVADQVEHYLLLRDDTSSISLDKDDPQAIALADSLWVFGGRVVRVWPDLGALTLASPSTFHDTLESNSSAASTEISISVDYTPLSVLLTRGIIFGLESDFFSAHSATSTVPSLKKAMTSFKTSTRFSLFIADILQHTLVSRLDAAGALKLALDFKDLPYFGHALEVLLHKGLDEDAERSYFPFVQHSGSAGKNNCEDGTSDNTEGVSTANSPQQQQQLPAILSLLSHFSTTHYLPTIVQCTRKTETRSWPTLFAHLPPVEELFERALGSGDLKTAGGLLLILHTLQQEQTPSLSSSSKFLFSDKTQSLSDTQAGGENAERKRERGLSKENQDAVVRLLRKAKAKEEWGLCKELARFLMALDEDGAALRDAISKLDDDDDVSLARETRKTEAGLGIHA